jgi:hypothetical protein
MVEGKEGLRHWEESVHIFLSDDRKTAFQHALEIGRRGEEFHEEGQRAVEKRLAGVVTLDTLGTNATEFGVNLGLKKATGHLAFEHVFDPEGSIPSPMFWYYQAVLGLAGGYPASQEVL